MEAEPFEVRQLYRYLRVVDVSDAMDGIGYFDRGLVSPQIRPLWPGMRFWGVAFTVRCVPARRPMWALGSTQEIINAHGIWFRDVEHPSMEGLIRPGHVVVMDTGGAGEVGFWGSANSLEVISQGAVGIVTDGYCRDTRELELERVPICARGRGRTIIPGRIEVVEYGSRIGCGGVQVRPGDIVGADDDGVIVVPLEVAVEVARHAVGVLLADMRARRRLYERAGLAPDETVDYQAVEAYYQELIPQLQA